MVTQAPRQEPAYRNHKRLNQVLHQFSNQTQSLRKLQTTISRVVGRSTRVVTDRDLGSCSRRSFCVAGATTSCALPSVSLCDILLHLSLIVVHSSVDCTFTTQQDKSAFSQTMERKTDKGEKSSYLAPSHGSPKKREISAAGMPEPIKKLFSSFMSAGGSYPVRL